MKKNNESKRIESLSSWYIKEQLDFDKQLIEFRYESIKPYFYGDECLELGPADGVMTKFLINDFSKVIAVEGSNELLKKIPDFPNLKKIHSLFEDFNPRSLFNTIILDHVLEHIEKPVNLLSIIKDWLTEDGKLIIGVPNANSIHRLAAVKMGLLNNPSELNARDIAVGHRRVYSKSTFIKDVEDSGLVIKDFKGVFLKILSASQIQETWDEHMIKGFFELGKDFPEHAADLILVCGKK